MDGRTPDAGVTGILIAHLRAFGSGELKKYAKLRRMHRDNIYLSVKSV